MKSKAKILMGIGAVYHISLRHMELPECYAEPIKQPSWTELNKGKKSKKDRRK